jgi:hypothetical protein
MNKYGSTLVLPADYLEHKGLQLSYNAAIYRQQTQNCLDVLAVDAMEWG